MAKTWNNGRGHPWDRHDNPWTYGEEAHHYGWLKRTVIAILAFALIYGIHITDTSVSRLMDDGIRYLLNTQTDFQYLADRMSEYAPQSLANNAMFKRVQTTVARPADPLMYMNMPAEGKIVSPFGWRTHPVLKQQTMHEGIDIEAPLGASVRAAAPGKVKLLTETAQYGKTLVIDHGQDVETVYGYLAEVLVKSGDMVSQGQVVARVGKTGMTNTPLLYFEIREKGKPIDPMTRIKGDYPAKEGM